MNRTTEALHTKVTGPNGVKDIGGRVVAVQGPEFLNKYMTNMILPRRQELVTMIIASEIQHDGMPVGRDVVAMMIGQAYHIADEILLAERETLDGVIDKYWEVFMNRNKRTEEVMNTLVEESQDYSL
jgi:hypothetical protein